jgi:ATP-binding cassette subfamily B protein
MSEPLPGVLPSLWRSLRLGYRAEPRMLLSGFVTTMAAAVPDPLLALALSAIADATVSRDYRSVLLSALLLAVLITASWLLGIVSDRVNLRLTERAAVDIESHMARLHAGIPTIAHLENAEHINRLTLLRDHASTLSELYQMLFSEIGTVLRLAITIGILAAVRPEFIFLALFAIPPVLASHWRAGAEKQVEEAVSPRERLARSLFTLGTTADAAKEVRVAQVHDLLVQRSRAERELRYRALARSRAVSAGWVCLAYLMFGLALVGAVWISARAGSPGDVVLLLFAGSRLSQYLSQAVRETHLFRTIWLDGARRLAWLEDYAAAEGGPATAKAPAALKDGIELQHVWFSYPGSDRVVLEDMSLRLPAGKVVAIVGENGAGKSTLVKLLCGLYKPTRGRVLIDGTDLQAIPPGEWDTQVTAAFQDFVKFEYPLSESVGLGNVTKIEDKAAVGAALARAGAQGLASSLPDELETQLGASWSNGVELSHGQWQKIALARTFMAETPLLVVLDEPTSAFDARAEQDIFDRYAEAAADGTKVGQVTILVTHRFSTLRSADLIVVLDGARVTETGTHAELMAARGTYAELFSLQAAGYATEGSRNGVEGA